MKKGIMVLLAIAIVLVFLTSTFVVAIAKPSISSAVPAKEVMITSSDIPYQRWEQQILDVPNAQMGELAEYA